MTSSIPLPLLQQREIEAGVIAPLVKAFGQNGRGAAKTDPVVQQRFDELTHLAAQLQIRALQP